MTKAPEVNPAPNPFDPAALRSDHRQDFVRVHSPSASSIIDTATEAAARLNLIRGRDNKWRGRCPVCGYAKPTLEMAVEQARIAVSCNACGAVAGIAAMMGVATDIIIAPRAAYLDACRVRAMVTIERRIDARPARLRPLRLPADFF